MRFYKPNEDEIRAARQGTVFARLNRGIIRGTGVDRLDLLHRLSTGDIGGLKEGEEGITILTSDKGRVLEVVRVIELGDHALLLMQGTGVEEVRAWLDKYTIMDDFTTEDAADGYRAFGVYGEGAKPLLETLLGTAMPDSGRAARVDAFGGSVTAIRDVRLSGGGSFTLIASADAAEGLADGLKGAGCTEIGEPTRQALRIAVGQPEMGTELTPEYNPLEAGLVSYISFTKGCYIGQEVIARLDTYDKVKRRLIGIRLQEPDDAGRIADGAELTVREPVEDVAVGIITSLTRLPGSEGLIGLCYIRSAYASPGLPVMAVAEGGERIARGELAKLPF